MQGETMRMHACVLVRVRDGLIERIEEYLDPAAVAKLS
jgi:ketosteroid isomerase-like protein